MVKLYKDSTKHRYKTSPLSQLLYLTLDKRNKRYKSQKTDFPKEVQKLKNYYKHRIQKGVTGYKINILKQIAFIYTMIR